MINQKAILPKDLRKKLRLKIREAPNPYRKFAVPVLKPEVQSEIK